MMPPLFTLELITAESVVVTNATKLIHGASTWNATASITSVGLYSNPRKFFVKNLSTSTNLYLVRGTYSPTNSQATYMGAANPTINATGNEVMLGPQGWDWFDLPDNEVLFACRESADNSSVLVRAYKFK